VDGWHRRPEAAGEALWCEGIRLSDIAEVVGTPLYVYSTLGVQRQFRAFADAFAAWRPLIAYAVKANGNLSLLRTLAAEGAGADTVSEGEIRRALAAGIAPERIVFSGVGKTEAELVFALGLRLASINVESEPELDRLATLAESRGGVPTIAIRVNPEVGAGGHAKITTGGAGTKFGVSLSEAERLYARATAAPWLNPVGLACHIGSQIGSLQPLEQAFITLRGLVERLRAQGLAVSRLDLGGGLAAPTPERPEPPAPADLAALVERTLGDLGVEFVFEPGRVIVADAGVLLSRVTHVHARPDGRRFLVLDAGMNDLIRPALYDAHHPLEPLSLRPGARTLAYDVVGPVCETSDIFAHDERLPELRAGDLVAFRAAGAYSATMTSEYNARPLAPEVLVDGDRWAVVRSRPSYDDMLAREPVAPWLNR